MVDVVRERAGGAPGMAERVRCEDFEDHLIEETERFGRRQMPPPGAEESR